jgi:uncharacterized protein YbjT (DUF2867 family)
VGSHIVHELLTHGARVRGTVRSKKSAEPIEKLCKQQIADGKLEIVYVPDITVDGAFDEALKGELVLACVQRRHVCH